MNNKSLFLGLSLFIAHPIVFAADISQVSINFSGERASATTFANSMSADGRYVVFHSLAEYLVDDDNNNHQDVFIHDQSTGVTELVSVSSSGEQGDLESSSPSISADGRFVAFFSDSTNLVAGDTNSGTDLFIHDRQTGVTERISTAPTGARGDALESPALSGDGRFVAYESASDSLVPGDTNGWSDIFLHDRQAGTTQIVSRSESGELGNFYSKYPSISADGRFIAFYSKADNLVPGDTSFSGDVFVRDRVSGAIERINVSPTGDQADAEFDFTLTSISADGRFVAFPSPASNLVENDTNQDLDIFVRDRQLGTTERVSVSSSGEQAVSEFSVFNSPLNFNPSISADGRFVAFQSDADNLADNDGENDDIYIHDRQTGVTEVASVSSNVAQGLGRSEKPSISADGQSVAFTGGGVNQTDSTFLNGALVATTIFDGPTNDLITVEKLINYSNRDSKDNAAQILIDTQYRQAYRVTNNSLNRLYQVKVFDDGNLVCDFYALNAGETKTRCASYETALFANQSTNVRVNAKVTGSGDSITNTVSSYYFGHVNVTGELSVTHRINNVNADTVDSAVTINAQNADVLFRVENTGVLELYRVKAYHDPVSPVNSGWEELCLIGVLKPGQVRYCKRPRTFSNSGSNLAVGRVQGANAIISPTDIINASNPTYFNAP